MDDAVAMGLLESVRNLTPIADRLVDRQRAPLEPCRQRLALEQLHDEVVAVALAADVVDGADVGVVQARDGLGFALETRPSFLVARQLLGQDLDRDVSLEASVPRFVDLTHAAGPDGLDDLVRPQLRARLDCHGIAGL